MNWIAQPPLFYRLLFPEALWRIGGRDRRTVYLTFDDGPIPEVTPWVLDTLDAAGIKATFFMVGDNVRRNPGLLDEVRRRGHSVGNHTMHHVKGFETPRVRYLRDIAEADSLIASPLFRPPHGLMRWSQAKILKRRYTIIMYDVVTRDYSRRLNPDQVFDNVRRYARPGSIIVFHDSLKAERNLREVLPRAIEWLKSEGYSFGTL